MGTEIKIDVDENGEQNEILLCNSIKERMKQADAHAMPSSSQSVPIIHKVPEVLRQVKESAYTPHLVSIGPIHKETGNLKNTEVHKTNYMISLFRRTKKSDETVLADTEQTAALCSKAMFDILPRVQDWYGQNYVRDWYGQNYVSNLAEVMIVDGCFILEFLHRNNFWQSRHDDPIFGNGYARHNVTCDLILFENQIPFFVLQKLFDLTLKPILEIPYSFSPRTYTLTALIFCFFGNFSPFRIREDETITSSSTSTSSHHILGLLHQCYLAFYYPSSKVTSNQPIIIPAAQAKPQLLIEEHRRHSATALHLAGVQFDRLDEDLGVGLRSSYSCWFCCGHSNSSITRSSWIRQLCSRFSIKVPFLFIHDSTETLLRNLIAFEQCTPGIPTNITSYACIMDRLISTVEDVELLEKEGVLLNDLTREEDSSNLFSSICKGVDIPFSDAFSDHWRKVEDYCSLSWPRNLASLRREYLTSPWAVISIIAGSIIIILTLIQTVFTVTSAYNK